MLGASRRVVRLMLTEAEYSEWLECGETMVRDWLVRGSASWRAQLSRQRAADIGDACPDEPNAFERWLGECVLLAGNGECDHGAFTPAGDLYASYRVVADRHDQYPRSPKAFARDLRDLALVRGKQGGKRGYFGISFRPAGELAPSALAGEGAPVPRASQDVL